MQHLLQMSSHRHHPLPGSLLRQPINVQHGPPCGCMLTVMLVYNSTCASQNIPSCPEGGSIAVGVWSIKVLVHYCAGCVRYCAGSVRYSAMQMMYLSYSVNAYHMRHSYAQTVPCQPSSEHTFPRSLTQSVRLRYAEPCTS